MTFKPTLATQQRTFDPVPLQSQSMDSRPMIHRNFTPLDPLEFPGGESLPGLDAEYPQSMDDVSRMLRQPALMSPAVRREFDSHPDAVSDLKNVLGKLPGNSAATTPIATVLQHFNFSFQMHNGQPTPPGFQPQQEFPHITPNVANLLHKIGGPQTPTPFGMTSGDARGPGTIPMLVVTKNDAMRTLANTASAQVEAAPVPKHHIAKGAHLQTKLKTQLTSTNKGLVSRMSTAAAAKARKPVTGRLRDALKDDEAVQKYDQKRDRNNVAVRKCREKKKAETEMLAHTAKLLTDRCTELEEAVQRLEKEKRELLNRLGGQA